MRRMAMAVTCLLVLAGCRVDVVVDLVVEADGTGELVFTATADADVVDQVPGLAEDLRVDDAAAAGWVVEGPTPTDAGGLTITLRHRFASAQEAINLLASLGPPFTDVRVDRQVTGDTATLTLTGTLTLPDGFDSFADADLLGAVGGTPFADDLAASDATPESSMSVRLDATLPGDVEETTGATGTGVDGRLSWEAPLDGSAVELMTRAVQRPAATWASVVSIAALVLLVVWVLLAGAFVVSVARVRRRRARRRGLSDDRARRLDELGAPRGH